MPPLEWLGLSPLPVCEGGEGQTELGGGGTGGAFLGGLDAQGMDRS